MHCYIAVWVFSKVFYISGVVFYVVVSKLLCLYAIAKVFYVVVSTKHIATFMCSC